MWEISELGHKADNVDNSIKASWKFQIHEQTMGEAWYIRKKKLSFELWA